MEKKNLAMTNPIVASFYREQIRSEQQRISEFRATLPGQEQKAVIDRQTEEQLRALGYLNK